MGEKAEAFGKSIYTAAKGPLTPSGKQGLERRVLSACWAGTGHRTVPAHPHSAPSRVLRVGGDLPGAVLEPDSQVTCLPLPVTDTLRLEL